MAALEYVLELGSVQEAPLKYHNIFKRANSRLIRATRLVVGVLTVLVIGYYVAAFFVSIFRCTPLSKEWYSKSRRASCLRRFAG